MECGTDRRTLLRTSNTLPTTSAVFFRAQAGAFIILDRLQRHYATFACSIPEKSDLQLIYGYSVSPSLFSFFL